MIYKHDKVQVQVTAHIKQNRGLIEIRVGQVYTFICDEKYVTGKVTSLGVDELEYKDIDGYYHKLQYKQISNIEGDRDCDNLTLSFKDIKGVRRDSR